MDITIEMLQEIAIESMNDLSKVIPAKIINSTDVYDYRFELTKTKNIAGTCYYFKPLIKISGKCVHNHTEKNLRNTIVHELLHAIFKADGHKKNWKKYATLYNSNEKLVNKTGKIERLYQEDVE